MASFPVIPPSFSLSLSSPACTTPEAITSRCPIAHWLPLPYIISRTPELLTTQLLWPRLPHPAFLLCLCVRLLLPSTLLPAAPTSATMVRHIENLDEFKKALAEAEGKLVVVDFTATWCGPCKMIAPFFEGLSAKYMDVVFLKVDVDDAQDVASHCEIKCMPTFHFYKNGERVHEFSGANQASLEQKVKELK